MSVSVSVSGSVSVSVSVGVITSVRRGSGDGLNSRWLLSLGAREVYVRACVRACARVCARVYDMKEDVP